MALAGGWVALTLQGAAVAGVSFWEAFDHRGPVGSAHRGHPLRPRVRPRHRRHRAVHGAGRGGLRRRTARPAGGAGAGSPGRGARHLGAGGAGHLRARRRSRAAGAGGHAGRGARRRGGGLGGRPAAARLGDAPRHPRPARRRAHPGAVGNRPAVLEDRPVERGGAGRDRPLPRPVRVWRPSRELWSTSYGRVLLGKVAVLAVLVAARLSKPADPDASATCAGRWWSSSGCWPWLWDWWPC